MTEAIPSGVILRRAWDGWSRGRIDDVMALLHPQFEWTVARADGAVTHRGADNFARFTERLRRDYKTFTIVLDRTEDRGADTVLALGSASGRPHGQGEPFERGLAVVVDFRDGLIARAVSFADEAAARDDLAERVGPA